MSVGQDRGSVRGPAPDLGLVPVPGIGVETEIGRGGSGDCIEPVTVTMAFCAFSFKSSHITFFFSFVVGVAKNLPAKPKHTCNNLHLYNTHCPCKVLLCITNQ